jgi:hypothetical protein
MLFLSSSWLLMRGDGRWFQKAENDYRLLTLRTGVGETESAM